MPSPVLITGHERSGTTLLRRLISMHPDLEYDLLHEQWRLDQFASAEDAEARYRVRVTQKGVVTGATASIVAGEKVPYAGNLLGMKNYVQLFKEYWPSGWIFHIVRQVDDVVDSCWRTFKIKTNIRSVQMRVDKMVDFLRLYSHVVAVDYDILVAEPEIELKRLYALMGTIPDSEYMHRVLHTQAGWTHNGRIMCGLRYRPYVGKDSV